MGFIVPRPADEKEEKILRKTLWERIKIGAIFFLIIFLIMLADIFITHGLP